MDGLEQVFADSVAGLGGDDAGATAAASADLLRRWSDPGRGYHDREHLEEVLARLVELAAAWPAAVLAAWFHDAVYTGHPGRDERDSADLARRTLLDLGVVADAAQRVGDLVLATADHVAAEGDTEAAALCDADLAVLASDPQRYARYAAGVRHEYRHVPGPVFRRGRAAVLRRLLERADDPGHRDGPLYRTPAARRAWTSAAQTNLRAELERLES